MVTRLTAAVLALATAIASPAAAQTTAPSVDLLGERGALDAAKLDTLVRLELGADASLVSAVTIAVRGRRAEVDVRLDVEHRKGSFVIETVEPERALALFVAELARGAAMPPPARAATEAPAIAQTEERPAAPPLPMVTPGSAASAPPWRVSVLGSIGARIVTAHGALLTTPAVELGARRDGALRLGAVARYAYATSNDPLGSVRAHVAAGGLAATYVLTSGGPLAVATGPRFEAGVVAGRGAGSNGTSTTDLALGVSWALEVHLLLGGVSVVGALEAGTLFRGVELHANERDVLHLAGPFLGFAIGPML